MAKRGKQGKARVGREKELDELVARALQAPGATPVDRQSLAGLPIVRISHAGRAPVTAAGGRAARPAASTLGGDPGGRHSWVPIGPRNVAGRVRSLACADPATALVWYAASAGGGVWKTTNAGRRWLPLWHDFASLAVGAVAVAPNRPQRVYAATGEASPSGLAVRGHGIFMSDDAGVTWTNHGAGTPPASNPPHRGGFEALAVDPANHNHCWAAGIDGLFRTRDGGQHWDQFVTGTHFTDVAFNGAHLFAVRGRSQGGEGAVLRLNDPAGDAAAQLASNDSVSIVVAALPAHLPWPAAGKIAIAPSNADIAYVRFAGEDDRHLGVFRTNTSRAALGRNVTWTRLRDHHQWLDDRQGTYNLAIAVDPTDAARVATGMVYVHVSTNAMDGAAAVRWQRVMGWEVHDEGLRAHHADQHHLVIAGVPPALWVADDGGVARSPDWATAATIDHGQRLRPDPARPLPAGSVRWQDRDSGISGAQFYDLAQNPLVPPVVAGGLQDNGTHLCAGGLTWRAVFGADGGFAAFDPDDPFRLYISYYEGLVSLQFPALLDRLFADGARDPGLETFRFLDDDIDDDAPFVPETARHPTRTGRVLHARVGRLYGLRSGNGERFAVEPVARSFGLRFSARPAPAVPPPPPPPLPPTDVVIADTPAAIGLGLITGQRIRPDRTPIGMDSRLPAPYRLAEGDELRITLNGVAHSVFFRAALGIDPARVQVADVVRLVAAVLPADQAKVYPVIWERPMAVQISTRGTGFAQQLQLGGTALAVTADGLSRLGLNAGTYHGDDGRPASVLFAFEGFDDDERRTNRDLAGGLTIDVAVNGGPVRSVRIEPPAFPDPAHVTSGELATALTAALIDPDPARAVDVAAVPSVAFVELRADPGFRVVLTGTAADRLQVTGPGAGSLRLGIPTLAGRHLDLHRRNRASVDLRASPPPAAPPPLKLVISDGVTATAPLRFTVADAANLRAVTVEELYRLVRLHLAVPAHAAVNVRAELVVFPVPGEVTALAFSPVHDQTAWAGVADGGLFRSIDDGVTWTEVGDARWRTATRRVGAIAPHPTDTQTAWVGLTGEAHVAGDHGFLWRTTDGGAHWDLVGHRVVGGTVQGVAVDGVPLGVTALELDPGDARVLFAATDAGVFRSTNRGDDWAPFGEGLPNTPIVDLAVEPTTRTLKAVAWTRGAYERRLGPEPPADVRLVIRANELDDGTRPPRMAPSLGTPAPGPLAIDSPDIKVVRSRPDVGVDADVDGAVFDLDLPHDDVVASSAAEVVVQVANRGALPVPALTPPPAADHVRVVVMWAPADAGPSPLPAELWMRLAAGPLPATLGDWTLVGDGTVPRVVLAGDTGIRSFSVNWPALDGVGRVGLLALTTAPADRLTEGPLTVADLVATERRAAYREVTVRRELDDRTLVLVSTDGRDIVVEQPAAVTGANGVADRLGFPATVIGTPGRVRVAGPAAAATYDLSVARPGVVIRAAAPIVVDLNMLPGADEADDPTNVQPGELAAMIGRRARAARLPVEAFTPGVGVSLSCHAGTTIRVAGGTAAPRLGWAPMAPAAATGFVFTNQTAAWFDLRGTPGLDLEVRGPGGAAFPFAVNLAEEHFADPAAADPTAIAALIGNAIAQARLSELVTCFANPGLAIRALGHGTLTIGGPAGAALGLPPGPDRVVASAPGGVNLSAGPLLHLEVTPTVLVRFDGDPAAIVDLAHAHPADARRAINLACEITSVPARAEVPSVALRVAASPADTAGRHPVSGDAHLAELAASRGPAADPAALFEPRAALGHDTLATGVANNLYLRVVNRGNVTAADTRLRLFRVDVAASPYAATQVAAVVRDINAGPPHIEHFTWDPGGAAGRVEFVLAVADQNVPGRRADPPDTFASPAAVAAFAAVRPSVALRRFDVVAP